MGRFINTSTLMNSTQTRSLGNLSSLLIPAGFLGIFGSGFYRVFSANSVFTIPTGVTSIRVRVVGGGGGARANGYGGAGGGYAHGVFSVTPGSNYSITVASGGSGPGTVTDGGSSSFGNLISATGGTCDPNGTTPTTGGQGFGGDFQAKGGIGTIRSGGGGAGSQLGDGGNALFSNGGGAGVGQGHATSFGGGSAFGISYDNDGAPDITGIRSIAGPPTVQIGSVGTVTNLTNGPVNTIQANIRFPFDGFTGGGGAANVETSNGVVITANLFSRGGPGAGGGASRIFHGQGQFAMFGGNGGVGGGGGAVAELTITGETLGSVTGLSGNGGIGGGAGSGGGASKVIGGGNGGRGLVVVEW